VDNKNLAAPKLLVNDPYRDGAPAKSMAHGGTRAQCDRVEEARHPTSVVGLYNER
jgi:hypothetical protein